MHEREACTGVLNLFVCVEALSIVLDRPAELMRSYAYTHKNCAAVTVRKRIAKRFTYDKECLLSYSWRYPAFIAIDDYAGFDIVQHGGI